MYDVKGYNSHPRAPTTGGGVIIMIPPVLLPGGHATLVGPAVYLPDRLLLMAAKRASATLSRRWAAILCEDQSPLRGRNSCEWLSASTARCQLVLKKDRKMHQVCRLLRFLYYLSNLDSFNLIMDGLALTYSLSHTHTQVETKIWSKF